MKRLAIILISLLLLILGGRGVADTGVSVSAQAADSICEETAPIMGREMCLMAMGGNAISGNTTSQGSSIRLTQTGRRVQPSTKTSVKLIKAGTVMDGRGSFLRGVSILQPLPGLFLFNWHLHLFGVLRL